MGAFLCLQCADKIKRDFESLCVGIIGKRECALCGRIVDTTTEPYRQDGLFKSNYYVIRDEEFARLKARESQAADA